MRLTPILAWLLLALCKILPAEDLRGPIDTLLAAVPAGGQTAVVVHDLASDRVLYSRGGDQSLSPASLMKLLVSSAALLDLGTAWQFRTRVVGLGPVVDGAVPGLGVIGGGDPCFDGRFYDDDPSGPFRAWAEVLKRQGITRIDGDLVIDARLFSGPARPETYPQDPENRQRWYSAPASAFAWNDNCIEVRVLPTRPGQPAAVQVRPQSSLITVRNLTRSTEGRADNRMVVNRDPGSNTVTVSGSYSRATDWFPLAIHAEADRLAGDQLKAVLVEAGIAISGAVRLGEVAPGAGPLLVDQRHDLVPAIEVLNQRSQNFYGEQILRHLGVQRFQEGSIAAGCRAATAVLAERLGADQAAAFTLIDGCGLSYDNRANAAFFIRLLAGMHRSPVAAQFHGSLKEQWAGKARGRVKTGSLAISSCLAGYLDRPRGGGRVAFVILANKGSATGFGWGPTLRERLFQAIGKGLD